MIPANQGTQDKVSNQHEGLAVEVKLSRRSCVDRDSHTYASGI